MSSAVTLSDLTREQKLLWLYCNDCGRERDVDPASIPLPGAFAVPLVGTRLRCSKCGGRNVTSAPELHPGGVTRDRELLKGMK